MNAGMERNSTKIAVISDILGCLRGLLADRPPSRTPATINMLLKSQCILDYIVQLARVKLACGTAVSQVGGKAAGS